MRLEFLIPTRGLFGYRNEFLTDTTRRGHHEPRRSTATSPYKGDISKRRLPARWSRLRPARPSPTACATRRSAARCSSDPASQVYAGMIVGQCTRNEDMSVNVCKKKQLTNMRAAGSRRRRCASIPPTDPRAWSSAMEYLADDELLEVTPKSLRMRKRHARPRRENAHPDEVQTVKQTPRRLLGVRKTVLR